MEGFKEWGSMPDRFLSVFGAETAENVQGCGLGSACWESLLLARSQHGQGTLPSVVSVQRKWGCLVDSALASSCRGLVAALLLWASPINGMHPFSCPLGIQGTVAPWRACGGKT